MADTSSADGATRGPSWRTRLLDPRPRAVLGFRSLATPVYRGSTTVFERAAELRNDWRQEKIPYAYGLHGTPTTFELAARIAELENARYTFITPGGQAAIALIYLAFASNGDHVLVPDSAYGPNRDLANEIVGRLGISVEFYDPLIGGRIADLIRPNTRLVWCESPGSVTMEVQDVPAIAAAVHRHGAVVAIDNTYAAGVLFDAFAHGADVSMQALTKYVGGHSDLLLGSVSTCNESHYEALGRTRELLGLAASPDDCALALRGLQTLGVRLAQLETSTLAVARRLATHPEIELVLHPALESCPGHDVWVRDFCGSASIFSIVLKQRHTRDALLAVIDRLQLFQIGYSWGGVTSIVAHFELPRQQRSYRDRLIRLNIGLEDVDDLMTDLAAALAVLTT